MKQLEPGPKVESDDTAVLPTVNPIVPTVAARQGIRFFRVVKSAGLLLIASVVLVMFLGFILGVRLPGMATPAKAEDIRPQPPARLSVQLVKGQPHTLLVSENVRIALGIRKGGKDRIEAVKAPTTTRPLTLYGSFRLDTTRQAPIRARFAPCEIRTIGKTIDAGKRTETGETAYRELRPGDRVKKGDVLGEFFSVEVGCKKNELLDALIQLKVDEKIYDSMARYSGSIAPNELERRWSTVQSDRNAINRALHNLKVWNIPQDEIDGLHAEAEKISADKDAWYKTPEGRWARGEKQATHALAEADKDKEELWGKVTLRAPIDGVIVERNAGAPGTIVVDNTVNLFQIAQVNRLEIIAYAPEDELPILNALTPEQRVWSVRTVGPVPVTGLQGAIEEIGYLIDPYQHTAIIKGYIDNPKEQLRAGQFVSCTVQIPPPPDVVEVPIDAVVEDGKYCVVFVQADPTKPYYTMRRVQLTDRFEKTAFVRSTPAEKERLTAEEKEMGMPPKEPLRPGERVLLSGVGELKAALIDLESRPVKR